MCPFKRGEIIGWRTRHQVQICQSAADLPMALRSHGAFLLNTVILCFKLTAGLLAQAAEQANQPALRGTPMVLGKALGVSVAFAMDRANWQQVKDLGLNTVRVCWVDPWFADRNRAHWTAEEVLPKLDRCVTNAQATRLNAIINYHKSLHT